MKLPPIPPAAWRTACGFFVGVALSLAIVEIVWKENTAAFPELFIGVIWLLTMLAARLFHVVTLVGVKTTEQGMIALVAVFYPVVCALIFYLAGANQTQIIRVIKWLLVAVFVFFLGGIFLNYLSAVFAV